MARVSWITDTVASTRFTSTLGATATEIRERSGLFKGEDLAVNVKRKQALSDVEGGKDLFKVKPVNGVVNEKRDREERVGGGRVSRDVEERSILNSDSSGIRKEEISFMKPDWVG